MAVHCAMQHGEHTDDLWLQRSIRGMAAASVRLGPTPSDEAIAWLENAQAEGVTFQPFLDVWRASLLADLGRFDEARSIFANAVADLSERGLTTFVAISMQEGWSIEMIAGDYQSAERAARQGCEQLDAAGGALLALDTGVPAR